MAIKFKEKNKNHKTKLEKFNRFSFIMCCIALFLAIMYVGLPVFTGLIGFSGLIIWLFIILLVSVCTIFTCWAMDGFKKFQQNFVDTTLKIMNSGNEAIISVNKVFPYLLGISAFFLILNVILTIVNFKKNLRKNKLISSLIISGLLLVMLVIDLVLRVTIYK